MVKYVKQKSCLILLLLICMEQSELNQVLWCFEGTQIFSVILCIWTSRKGNCLNCKILLNLGSTEAYSEMFYWPSAPLNSVEVLAKISCVVFAYILSGIFVNRILNVYQFNVAEISTAICIKFLWLVPIDITLIAYKYGRLGFIDQITRKNWSRITKSAKNTSFFMLILSLNIINKQ